MKMHEIGCLHRASWSLDCIPLRMRSKKCLNSWSNLGKSSSRSSLGPARETSDPELLELEQQRVQSYRA